MGLSAKFFWLLLLAAFIAAGVYFFLWKNHALYSPSASFVYEEIAVKYPVFDKESSATKENIIQVAQELEQTTDNMKDAPQTVAYARYLVARAYINAVIANQDDQESLNKALDYAASIIKDDGGYQNIRAYTVALVDTLLYPAVGIKVKNSVQQHPYFSRFGEKTSGSTHEFRFNLLSFGNNLHRMTDIKYRLAILETQRLAKIQRTSTAIPATWENVRGLIADAESSLARDRSGEMPFGNRSYLVEPLFHRAQLAAYYYGTTNEKPFGDIDALYQEALQMANDEMPKLRPLIEFSYDQYKNHGR